MSGAAANALREAIRVVGSGTALLALVAPLALVALVVAAGQVGAARAAAAWSVRVWTAAAALSLATSAVVVWRRGHRASALLRLAALCALAQPFAWAAARYHAVAEIGEHEEGAPWTTLAPGAVAGPPPIVVEEASPDAVRLRFGDREERVPTGRSVTLADGAVLKVDGPFPAPRFEVRRAGGAVEAAGFVKLVPARRAFLEAGVLPHRIYVTAPEAPPGRASGKLRLRVQRGKLRIVEGDVVAGEEVRFEGISFAFGEGAAWVRVEVRREPRPWLLGVAGVLAGAAAIHAGRGRVRARTVGAP